MYTLAICTYDPLGRINREKVRKYKSFEIAIAAARAATDMATFAWKRQEEGQPFETNEAYQDIYKEGVISLYETPTE